MSNETTNGAPLARYAAAKRVGDFLFLSGVIAVDPARRRPGFPQGRWRADPFRIRRDAACVKRSRCCAATMMTSMLNARRVRLSCSAARLGLTL